MILPGQSDGIAGRVSVAIGFAAGKVIAVGRAEDGWGNTGDQIAMAIVFVANGAAGEVGDAGQPP